MMRQLKATCRELGRLIEAYEQTLDDSDDPQSSQRQRDVEILSSIPGVGRIVLATLLAEASEILKQRNYNALRAFCGSAPVTKRSGKICVVVRRRAVNNRLQTALYHWTRVALQHARPGQSSQIQHPARADTDMQGLYVASLTAFLKSLAPCWKTNSCLIMITPNMNWPLRTLSQWVAGLPPLHLPLTNGRMSPPCRSLL